jgi:hypothetical protein
VVQDGRGISTHQITVSQAELGRYGGDGPAALVERSFEFLLEREPKESILRRFAVSDIERYFPDFPGWVRGPGS